MNKRRYQRNIMVPEIGIDGQERLARAKVLVVGAGGLGSPVLQYLAAAGVGTIGVVDADTVDESNLQRQTLYKQKDTGKPKAELAKQWVDQLNNGVLVNVYQERYSEDNCQDISEDYQIIVDCTDNYQSRYVINDYAVSSQTPFIHGAVELWQGQVFSWVPGSSCYQCLFKTLPQNVPAPSSLGIIGAIPGVIGSIQATEAIKMITGSGELLTNCLLTYNALSMRFQKISLERDSSCPACADK